MPRPQDQRESRRDSDEGDGIIALVRETADGLGRLIADHIKLARTEIVADAKSYGRQLGVLLVAVFVLALGYGLGCIAGALALGHVIGGPLAFLAVAGLHLLLGAVGVVSAARKMRRRQLMQETAVEVGRSLSALSAQPRVAPTRTPIPAGPGSGRQLG